MLRQYPMVVGEWSLALGSATWATCGRMEEHEVYRLFASAQLEAFKDASHGCFFWNWTEEPDNLEWNCQLAHERGLFAAGPRPLPALGTHHEDPLEELCHPSPFEPRVRFGDPLHIRVFHGRYIDVEGSKVNARWPDKGDWQTLRFFFVAESASGKVGGSRQRKEVRHGDIIRIQGSKGQWLSVADEGHLSASRRSPGLASEFSVHLPHTTSLRHRGVIFLQSRATQLMVDADPEEEGVYARYGDLGWWQQLAVEKATSQQQWLKPSISVESLPPTSTPQRATALSGSICLSNDSISPEKDEKHRSPKKRTVAKVSGTVAVTPLAKTRRVQG